MRLVLIVWAFMALAFVPVAWADEAVPTPPTLDDFLSDATFWGPELSPSGRYVAGIKSEDNRQFVVTIDLDDPDAGMKATEIADSWVNWLEWASDDRLLMALTAYVDERGRLIKRYKIEDDPTMFRIPVRRLYAVDREGGNAIRFFDGDRALERNLSLSRITDFLEDDAEHVLVPARLRGDLDLFKVNVNTGVYERIAIGTRHTIAWYTDEDGEPALQIRSNRRGTVFKIFAREAKENGEYRWKKIRTVRINRRRNGGDEPTEFDPVAPGPDLTTYYVLARPDDADTIGLYLYDFEKDEFLETLKSVPGHDLSGAFFNSESGEYYGTYHYADRLEIEWEDQGLQAHITGLNNYFGNTANVYPIDYSRDGTRWLLYASGPTERGSYHIYNFEEHSAFELGAYNASFLGKTLAPTTVINYQARDGLELTGYLTRPATAGVEDTPPLVMMPHGGPEMRDRYRYDQEVQVLVAQGYQVFQPNFRGSEGFGESFADAGRRQWGKLMQTDVEDGFAHLVREGFADPDRTCIYGYSYGGYVAMFAATMTPELYQCVIAGAGPVDLVKFLQWVRREEGRGSDGYEYWVEHIGHPRNDKDAINAVSPTRHAEGVRAPILLIHGEDDYIVPIEQSEIMAEALEDAGKDVSFVRLENAGHSYRSDDDERLEYEEIIAFLAEHLPVEDSAAPAPPAETSP